MSERSAKKELSKEERYDQDLKKVLAKLQKEGKISNDVAKAIYDDYQFRNRRSLATLKRLGRLLRINEGYTPTPVPIDG